MARTAPTTITIDTKPIIAAIQTLVDRAVSLAVARAIDGATKPAPKASNPRVVKATQPKATPASDPAAPYGRRADGTPKGKPGRKPVAPVDATTPPMGAHVNGTQANA